MSDASSVSPGLAFTAGLVSFLSPCVAPLLPSYLGIVSGLTLDELANAPAGHPRRMLSRAAVFLLGFALVFVSLGAVATPAGVAIARALPWLQRLGGVLLLLFGAYLLGGRRLIPFMRERSATGAPGPAAHAAALATGLSLGAAWTPCVGPVLATILLLAGTSGTAARGMSLLVAYVVGLVVPFMLLAVASDRLLSRLRAASRWARPLTSLDGAFLLLVGFALLTGRFQTLTAMLAGLGQLVTLTP